MAETKPLFKRNHFPIPCEDGVELRGCTNDLRYVFYLSPFNGCSDRYFLHYVDMDGCYPNMRYYQNPLDNKGVYDYIFSSGKFSIDSSGVTWIKGRKISFPCSPYDRDKDIKLVYFMVTPVTNKVKIGISRDPSNRLRYFQTSSHEKIVLLHSILGGREAEETIQKIFNEYHVSLEWFSYTGALKEFIHTVVYSSTNDEIVKLSNDIIEKHKKAEEGL